LKTAYYCAIKHEDIWENGGNFYTFLTQKPGLTTLYHRNGQLIELILIN